MIAAFLQSAAMIGLASRRAAASAIAVLCVTCQSQVAPAPSRAEEQGHEDVAPPAPAASLRPDVAAVAPESAIGRARAALAGDPAEARRIAAAELAGASEDDRAVLSWIAARAAEATGDASGARASYAAIPDAHPLSRWARLAQARSLVATAPLDAIPILEPLIAADWTGRGDARAADALARAAAADPDAEARLRASSAAGDAPRADLERALAELLAAREDEASRIEALATFRWIEVRAPGSRAGREALARAAEVLAALGDEARAAHALPTIEQQIVRAEALAASMDHQGAEDAFAEVLPRIDPEDRARRCAARLGQGRSMFRRRARREAVPVLTAAAEDCGEERDVRAWARYWAAKSYSGLDRMPEAIAQYDVLAEELPDHRLADDALVTAARLAADRGDDAGMRSRLERVVAMPGADMRGEARFLLAWHAREGGRLDDALAQLDASIAEGPGETAEDVRGRAAYWRARVREELGQGDAAEGYEAVARDVALTYYGQQALARLAAIDRARALRAMAARREEALELHGIDTTSPALARAIALLRAGELALGERELGAAGMLGEGAPPEGAWAAAALLDRAGAYSRSCEIVRRQLRHELGASTSVARWRLGYPRAYHPLIESVAEDEGVPPAFVRAIAREESSFRADAVSVAHAYGLLQIIRPTAQRVGRPLGLRSDPASLRTPEINVRIGVRYMAGLQRRYGGQAALIPAAYNAGEGRVDQWLRADRRRALDEFIEEIPYDETRRYSRRVLQTWGIYAWLDEGSLPQWPTTLPAE